MAFWKSFTLCLFFFLLVGSGVAQTGPLPQLRAVWFDWAPCHAFQTWALTYPNASITVDCVPLGEWHTVIWDNFALGLEGIYDLLILDSQFIGEGMHSSSSSLKQHLLSSSSLFFSSPSPSLFFFFFCVGEAVEGKHLASMDELVANLDRVDFYDEPFRAYSEYPPFSEHYWGVPFESDVMLLVYRKDIFAQLGIDDIVNYNDLVRVANLIQNGPFNSAGFGAPWCTSVACYDQGSTVWNQIAWRYFFSLS